MNSQYSVGTCIHTYIHIYVESRRKLRLPTKSPQIRFTGWIYIIWLGVYPIFDLVTEVGTFYLSHIITYIGPKLLKRGLELTECPYGYFSIGRYVSTYVGRYLLVHCTPLCRMHERRSHPKSMVLRGWLELGHLQHSWIIQLTKRRRRRRHR